MADKLDTIIRDFEDDLDELIEIEFGLKVARGKSRRRDKNERVRHRLTADEVPIPKVVKR